jgi:SAM-dependent methyltransferase
MLMAVPTPSPAGYADIDRTADPAHFIRSLGRIAPLWQPVRDRTYTLLEPRPGQRLLDVGCGTGETAQELARRVGGSGRVVGVDRSETMIAEAGRRARDSGLPVEFGLGDACHLPFADGAYDGCRAERVLMHLADPERALAEMCRVARPGGRVVVAEVDSDTRVLDAPDRALTRRILNCWCDQYPNGWMGRQLPRLMREVGLIDLAVSAHTAITTDPRWGLWGLDFGGAAALAVTRGAITAAEAQGWLARLQEAERAGYIFGALTTFIVGGRKP